MVGTLPEGRGIVIADGQPNAGTAGQAIRLTALSPQRDTLWQQELPAAPIPLTAAHIAAAVLRTPPYPIADCSTRDATAAAPPAPEQIAAAYAASEGALRHLPALTGLSIGQDGSIWIRREESAADSTTWQLLDVDGAPKGFLRLPIGERVVAAREDIFVTSEVDELDVPYLVRYRLTDR